MSSISDPPECEASVLSATSLRSKLLTWRGIVLNVELYFETDIV